MKSTVSIFKKKTFLIALGLFLGLVSALIIVSLNIGQNSGTFVIKVQESNAERQIKLSLDENDESQYIARLETGGIDKFVDNNPQYYLEKDENNEYTKLKSLTAKAGENHTKNEATGNTTLFCYTFYILNTGVGTVDVSSYMNYSNVTKYNDKIARIMTVRENSVGNIEALDIYYQKDDDDSYVDYTTKGYPVNPYKFVNSTTVFNCEGDGKKDERFQIREKDYVKYSVFYWMEGTDPDSDKYGNDLLGGTIRFDITFNVDMAA